MPVRPNALLSSRTVGLSVLLSALVIVGLFAPVAQAAPDPLTVSVSGSPNPVQSGTSLTWTIQVVNSEPDLKSVRLTDQLHGIKNLVLTSSRGYCTESNLLVTCEAGSMPGHNETWTVTIRGIITAADGEVLNNAAIVTGRKGGQDFSVPGTGSVLVSNQSTGSLADLSLSIAAPDSVAGGGNVPYTLIVNNSGAVKASDVVATATMPPGFAATSANGTNLFDCVIANPTVTCTGGAVNDGANATIAIQATANAAAGSYDTTAVVDPEDAIAESNEENNTASDTIVVPTGPPPAEPMTFTKTASSPVDPANGAQVRPGDQLTYTITATNTSPKSDASKLQITDGTQGLEAASVQASSSHPGLVCTPSASQVDCRAPNENFRLRAGQSVVVTIVGTVVQTTGNVITNTAVLQTLQNRISITRRASVSTTVRPGVDLTVTQYSTCSDPLESLLPCGPFRARNQFDYLITVGNSGLNDANNVVVREPLPNDVIFEGWDNLGLSNWANCSVSASNVVTCTGGTVPGAMSSGSYPGTIRQLRLHLTAPNSIGPITSTVTVDPFNAIKESDETNNTFTTTTPIATGIDLTSMQSVNFDPVAPSGTLVYDVLITNIGTQDAGAIRISDVVPAGARFRSAKEVPNPFGAPFTPPHGFTCSFEETTQDVVCTDGGLEGIYAAYGGPPLSLAGTPDNVTIRITLFAPAPFGPQDSLGATGSPILNQVMVDPAGNIPEILDTNNLNILETNVGIPPPGDWGTYNELTVVNNQTNPVAGSVAPNGTLEYTLTVNNFGSDPASNVTVYDYIPQGARFRDARGDALSGGNGGFQCSFDAGLVSCGNGALAAAPSVGTPSSTEIHIKLFAPDSPNDQTSEYTNHAVVDPNNNIPEADETNNVSDVLLVVEVGGQNAYNQLIISIDQFAPTTTPPGPTVAPSGTLGYRVTIGNTGSDVAQQIAFRDFLPEGTRFRSARNNTTLSSIGSGGFACFHQDGIVECGNGTVQGGGMAVVDILLFAPEQPGTYDNQAVVDPANAIPEGNEQDNTASAETTVDLGGANEFIDLVISKLESDPTSIATDTAMKYKLEVKNEGSDRAFNVKLSDYLPVGTRFVSGVDDAPGPDAFTCSEAVGVVDCTGGSIPGGGTRNLTIVVRSPRHSDVTLVDNKTEITNEALIDPDNAIPEGDERNNTAYVTTTVLANVDLTADNLGGCAGSSGNECSLTFEVTNNGPDAVTDVMVRTDLPIGVIPLDVTAPADWACTTNENPINSVTCVRQASLGASGGTPETFTIRVYVTANSGNSISSTTVVDPGDTIVESDENNNTKSFTENA